MERYHVYNWVLDEYILIDTETRDLYFFSTNYKKLMGDYHLENPKVENISKQKINGLIRRIKNNTLNYDNSFVIDKYIYHLLMSEEQRELIQNNYKNLLDINKEKYITSGDNYSQVIKAMQEIVNNKEAA